MNELKREDVINAVESQGDTIFCGITKGDDVHWITFADVLALLRGKDAEIENLTEIADVLWDQGHRVCNAAITEFAERVKNRFANMEYSADTKRKTIRVEELYAQVNWVLHEVVPDTIDQIATEMRGKLNG